jgi:hypothetical protein
MISKHVNLSSLLSYLGQMKAKEMPFQQIYVSTLQLINENRDIREEFHFRGSEARFSY